MKGGTPISGQGRGYSHSWMRGYPHPGMGDGSFPPSGDEGTLIGKRGNPYLWTKGEYPIPWMRGYSPSSVWGYSLTMTELGSPQQDWIGVIPQP